LLNNAFEGYNVCLFAYGQTGSGKSYSIAGYPGNIGIVPRACKELFDQVKKGPSTLKHLIYVSIIEIYNEKVQDLLIPPKNRPAKGLAIREDKDKGMYVENLTQIPVSSYD